MVKFILGVIVVVFTFWGVGSYRSQRLSVLANVNGEKILMESYRIAHANMLERYKQMFGGRIPEGFMDKLDLKQQVIDSLVNEILIRQTAQEMGILVSNEEIQTFVLSIPAFKNNGVFDQTQYERALRTSRLTPAVFETQIRQQILTERLRALLTSGLSVTEAEATDHYMYKNEEVDLSFASIGTSECKGEVNATEEDLASWYDLHRENYMTEPRIKLRYLIFKEADFREDVNVTDIRVQSYYNDYQNEYEVEERRSARHILLKIPQGVGEDEVEEIRKKTEKICEQIDGGEDFEKLAKEKSEDAGTAEKGGKLGLFGRGMMVKPFEDAAFSMKEGEVSKPVRSSFGWHIIKIEKIEPERVKSLEEVKDSIAAKLKVREARDVTWDKANQTYDEVIQLEGLDMYAEHNEIELESTEFFTQKRPGAVFGSDPELLKTIFALNSGELSSLLKVPQGVLIAEALDKKAPYVPGLEEVEKEAKSDYVLEKAVDLCRAKAEDLLEAAKKDGLDHACKEGSYEIRHTGLFKRTDRTAKDKLPLNVVQAGLSLHQGKIYPDEPAESGDRFYVLAFKGQKDADMTSFPEQKDAIIKDLLNQKRQTLFEDWLKHLRDKADFETVTNL